MRLQGGLIDRSKTLRFTFDGKSYQGHPGDTLASALLANGVRLMGRSFKYHRPRGVLSAGSEEPNALVELGRGARREPNTRATVTELNARWGDVSPGLTLVIADYDKETALKKRFGVTYQDTFVLLDGAAKPVKLWNSGGVDGLNRNTAS